MMNNADRCLDILQQEEMLKNDEMRLKFLENHGSGRARWRTVDIN